MEILAIHGLGADSESKADEFGAKVRLALNRTVIDSGVQPGIDLRVSAIDFSSLLDASPWEDSTKVRETYRARWPSDPRTWVCLCCTSNRGRSKKVRIAHVIASVGEDFALDIGADSLKSWLRRPSYRQAIRDHVLPQITTIPDVIVAHSLGTVIGLDLLSHWPLASQPQLFLTLGSPLSMESVWEKLPAQNQRWIAERPLDWVNLYDKRDHVTHAGALPASRFPNVVNVRVRNVRPDSQDRAHQVSRYLSHTFLGPLLTGYANGVIHQGDVRADSIVEIDGARCEH